MRLKFQWDDAKAALNLKNHRVGFDEARTVFDDPLAVVFYDEDHSIEEHREVIVGNSTRRRLLLVFFTQVAEDTIRIFSARTATKTERTDYEENAYP